MSSDLSATYISNGNYSEQAKTDAQWINGSYFVNLKTLDAAPSGGR